MLLVAWGSRGDVQPMVALGRGLQAAGLEVTVLAGRDFASFVTGAGLGFRAFPVDVGAMMREPLALRWLGGSRSRSEEIGLMREVLAVAAPMMVDGLAPALARTDAVITGSLSFGPLVELLGGRRIPTWMALLQPTMPTRSGAASMFPLVPDRDSVLNLVWGSVAMLGMFGTVRTLADEATRRLGVPRQTLGGYSRAMLATPALCPVSPLVVPHQTDWPATVHQTGYWIDEPDPGFRPPEDLAAFLADGPPPVYVGFGSMPDASPDEFGALVSSALARTGRRGLVGGVPGDISPDALGDHVHRVGSVPHEWLLPRTAAVVHHGGAGTTAAALRSGRPSAVVPHVLDQPFFGRRTHALGVGPAPVPRFALTEDGLADLVDRLVSTPSYQVRARELAAALRAEDGVGETVRLVTGALDGPPGGGRSDRAR